VTVEVLPYGDHALLVEVGDTGAVVAYVDALLSIGHPGVADVVPAARTVLVVARTSRDVPGLRQALGGLTPEVTGPGAAADEDVIEIPVSYDGPDLGDVARLTGLSEQDVVAAHTGTEWRVAFGGFAPGFGYLVTDHQKLHVPRRDSARTAVPAGAVGLAGEYTGVYPRESPGGWQLIGTTDAPMWDLERDPPALLRPGARIRFHDVGGGP
jgi:KipI family sensor histidine kinase inhibitor